MILRSVHPFDVYPFETDFAGGPLPDEEVVVEIIPFFGEFDHITANAEVTALSVKPGVCIEHRGGVAQEDGPFFDTALAGVHIDCEAEAGSGFTSPNIIREDQPGLFHIMNVEAVFFL